MKVTIHNADGTKTQYGFEVESVEQIEVVPAHVPAVKNLSSMQFEGGEYTVSGYEDDRFFFKSFGKDRVAASKFHHKKRKAIIKIVAI